MSGIWDMTRKNPGILEQNVNNLFQNEKKEKKYIGTVLADNPGRIQTQPIFVRQHFVDRFNGHVCKLF